MLAITFSRDIRRNHVGRPAQLSNLFRHRFRFANRLTTIHNEIGPGFRTFHCNRATNPV
jgi:hypothetical protein